MRQKIALCKWQFKRSKVISIVLGRCDLLSPGWLSLDSFQMQCDNRPQLHSEAAFTSAVHFIWSGPKAKNCFGSFSHHFVCSGSNQLIGWWNGGNNRHEGFFFLHCTHSFHTTMCFRKWWKWFLLSSQLVPTYSCCCHEHIFTEINKADKVEH